jgi:putative transposase
MQKVSTAYVMYYNKKYCRSGSLFEGKFKSKHASSDRYLKYLFSYIHLNPLKLIDKDWKENGIKNKSKTDEFLNKFQYSSYVDYAQKNKRFFSLILNYSDFPKYFLSHTDFKNDIANWLNYRPS